jgi:hypothetical protein
MTALFLLTYAGLSVSEPAATNLADYYLEHLDTLQTPEQRNAAILKCLAEIASIIDKTASKRAIQVELSGTFRAMLMSVDSRDKDVKTQYERLFDGLNMLEAKTTGAINETFTNVTGSLTAMRTNVLSKMGRALAAATRNSDNLSTSLQVTIADVIASHGQTSLLESVTYFAIFQGLIVISIYIIRTYVKNKGLPL